MARTDPSAGSSTAAAPLDGEHDPSAIYRHPLTVMAILAPIGILAGLYRLIHRQQHELFLDDVWFELGGFVGIETPFIPTLVLIVGCLVAHFLNKRPWPWSGPGVVLRVFGWASLWMLVRTVLGFTAHDVSGPATDDTAFVATAGMVCSSALQEELIFRGLLIGLCASIPISLGAPRTLAWGLCIAISAVLFGLAHTDIINHHPTAPPFDWSRMVQHTLAGVLYGVVFVRQGLAVTTLAHGGYNLVVISEVLYW